MYAKSYFISIAFSLILFLSLNEKRVESAETIPPMITALQIVSNQTVNFNATFPIAGSYPSTNISVFWKATSNSNADNQIWFNLGLNVFSIRQFSGYYCLATNSNPNASLVALAKIPTGVHVAGFTTSASGITFYVNSQSMFFGKNSFVMPAGLIGNAGFSMDGSNSPALAANLISVTLYNGSLSRSEALSIIETLTPTLTATRQTNLNLVFEGNSFTYSAATFGWVPQFMNMLGNGMITANNVAIPGNSTPVDSARGSASVDALYNPAAIENVLFFWEGSNDLASSGNTAQAYSNIANYALQREGTGWTVVIGTILPRGANPASFDYILFDANRKTVNNMLRASYLGFSSGLLDVGLDSEIGSTDAWRDLRYYDSQMIHLTGNGNAIVAELAYRAYLELDTKYLYMPTVYK